MDTRRFDTVQPRPPFIDTMPYNRSSVGSVIRPQTGDRMRRQLLERRSVAFAPIPGLPYTGPLSAFTYIRKTKEKEMLRPILSFSDLDDTVSQDLSVGSTPEEQTTKITQDKGKKYNPAFFLGDGASAEERPPRAATVAQFIV